MFDRKTRRRYVVHVLYFTVSSRFFSYLLPLGYRRRVIVERCYRRDAAYIYSFVYGKGRRRLFAKIVMNFLDGFATTFAGCQSFDLIGGGKQTENVRFVGLFYDVDTVLGVTITARTDGRFKESRMRLSRGKEKDHD
jgi:hypothetical protein